MAFFNFVQYYFSEPFTPYKIWVRSFYNFPLDGVMSSDLLERLGPQSESLYVLTDVRPPSAPIILNLTCDQPNGNNIYVLNYI